MINPYELEKLSQLTKKQIKRQAWRIHWIGAGKMKKIMTRFFRAK